MELAMTRTRERGLTLVEILIALTILAVVLLAIAPLFTGSVRANASASHSVIHRGFAAPLTPASSHSGL